jgi:hypothetical protein
MPLVAFMPTWGAAPAGRAVMESISKVDDMKVSLRIFPP